MDWIAVQPYYKVEREVSDNEQKTVVHNRQIYLYKEKVVTKHREFSILDVFDLSYRPIGEDGGLLYLHTRNGVYSYTVSADPSSFIKAYKDLVHSSTE